MISYGLLLLGVIQIFTAFSTFFSYTKDEIFGIRTLKDDMAVHRYMLTSLWISVGVIYLLGAFYNTFTVTALLLGIINITLEIIGYWFGFKHNRKFWWYPYAGTGLMGSVGVLCLMELLNSINHIY